MARNGVGARATENEQWPALHYEADPQWRTKLLTPAQVLIHDVRLEAWRKNRGALLELIEKPSSSLLPKQVTTKSSDGQIRASEAAKNPIERQNLLNLEEEYGWIRQLRLTKYQIDEYDSSDSAKCRWIHCSFKDQSYLRGFLWALSENRSTISDSLGHLDAAVKQHGRFSKHGKYFIPFSQTLQSPSISTEGNPYPMLLAAPFLDWSVIGPTPPLRFHVDKREGFRSTRSSVHLIRSVLEYFYRLEDTSDRESSQVFAKHKPWSTDRELDLKVRQWYGHYPTKLVVDEVWILVVDAMHIVTFSSNQSWKSRSPPLQLTSRITDVSFRGIRNTHFASQETGDYVALTHAVTCLSGAVGMMHRSFWGDLILPAADRYAGWLSHLQYRLHRAPSSKLVMDLIGCQEELNIVIQITQQQIEMITKLQSKFSTTAVDNSLENGRSQTPGYSESSDAGEYHSRDASRSRSIHREPSSSAMSDPTSQLLDNLQRELVDLQDLRDNTDRLVTRTIQLVNIRLEDHGKAILVFTVVTIIFLPLNFVSSFFGMNFRDIRDTNQTQWVFWAVALCVTAGVAGGSVFVAFAGASLLENMLTWRDKRRELHLSSATVSRQAVRAEPGVLGFRVLSATDQQTA